MNAKYTADSHELAIRFKTKRESSFTFETAATFCRLHEKTCTYTKTKTTQTNMRHRWSAMGFQRLQVARERAVEQPTRSAMLLIKTYLGTSLIIHAARGCQSRYNRANMFHRHPTFSYRYTYTHADTNTPKNQSCVLVERRRTGKICRTLARGQMCLCLRDFCVLCVTQTGLVPQYCREFAKKARR